MREGTENTIEEMREELIETIRKAAHGEREEVTEVTEYDKDGNVIKHTVKRRKLPPDPQAQKTLDRLLGRESPGSEPNTSS